MITQELVKVIAYILAFILFPIETMSRLLHLSYLPLWAEVVILDFFNLIWLLGEIAGVVLIKQSSKKLAQIHTPAFLKKIGEVERLRPLDFFLLGLTPLLQKGGAIACVLSWSKKGFLYLLLGATIRVSLYPFLGGNIWLIIVILAIVRLGMLMKNLRIVANVVAKMKTLSILFKEWLRL